MSLKARHVASRMFWRQLASLALFLIPASYLFPLMLDWDGARHALNPLWLAAALAGFGLLGPYLLIQFAVTRAWVPQPDDIPGKRLQRILALPRVLELGLTALYASGSVAWALAMTEGRNLGTVLLCAFVTVLLTSTIVIRQRLAFEQLLRATALDEFHRHPQLPAEAGWLLWPRQSWYLPYALGLFVLCTLTTVGLAVSARLVVTGFPAGADALGGAVWAPLGLLGGYLFVLAIWTAAGLAKQLREGTRAIHVAIESLASGNPRLPSWVATDEIGDLASTVVRALEQLRAFSVALRGSATALGQSARELGTSNTEQNEMLSIQAAALQQTQVTAQEIKQTSLLASQKAEGVLQQTERAEQIGRSGETALEQSLNGLTGIREEVKDMAQRIRALDERARQIANITSTVKDLADQSNMLALNAAIEAVRSGEHGKGFGVVAREIRNLADQSIQATNNVREILQDISEAIRTTVSITERGSEKVERSLEQVRAFGDNMRQLSGIVRDNASSVRQISAAVTQQNAGISQIFQAVNDLTKMMDQTMERLRSTDGATLAARTTAEKVTEFVGKLKWAETGQDAALVSLMPPTQPPAASHE